MKKKLPKPRNRKSPQTQPPHVADVEKSVTPTTVVPRDADGCQIPNEIGMMIYEGYRWNWGGTYTLAGYLVVHQPVIEDSADDMRLVAFVFCNDEEANSETKAFDHAVLLSRLSETIDHAYGPWINLTNCGHAHATERVPAFLYALRFIEPNAEASDGIHYDLATMPSFSLHTFCPVRFREMQGALAVDAAKWAAVREIGANRRQRRAKPKRRHGHRAA